MPYYDYRCDKCQAVKEVFHDMSVRPRLRCECGNADRFTRVPVACAVAFKGEGWARDNYSKKPSGASK